MKKIFTFIFCLAFISINVFSQITLGPGDFATSGLQLKVCQTPSVSNGSMNSSVSLGTSGANGVYNISGAAAFVNDTVRLNFVNPASLPNPLSVPGSNVAVQAGYTMFDMTGDTLGYYYIYMNSDNNGLYANGVALNWDTALFTSLTPGQPWGWSTVDLRGGPVEMMSTSYALGYSYYDSAWSAIQLFGWITYRVDNLIKTTLIDGWGSLTTPIGTYQVLRGKSTYRHNQAWVMDTNNITWEKSGSEHIYEFYAKGIGFPVAMIGYNDETFTNVEWIKYVSAPPASVQENQMDMAVVYPTIASNEIIIENISDGIYSVYDMCGREIIQNKLNKDNNTSVNVSQLVPGMYFIVIEAKGSVKKEKFIKQ